MTVLATDGCVTIRRLSPRDLEAFQAYRNDPVVGRWQGWSKMSDEAALGFLSAVSDGTVLPRGEWNQLAISDAGSDHLLGDLGLHLSADGTEAELGITLAQDAQGKGIAKAALDLAFQLIFDQSQATRIICITDQRNLPCLALLRRAGMTHVETLDTEFQGAPCKEEVFEITRPA